MGESKSGSLTERLLGDDGERRGEGGGVPLRSLGPPSSGQPPPSVR